MELQHDYHYIGHLTQVRETLKRSVSQYIRYHNCVKIGITNNPERRKKEYAKSRNWDKMVVLYSTTSLKYIREIERELIEYNWDYVHNLISGGGGDYSQPPYYLYVVIRD